MPRTEDFHLTAEELRLRRQKRRRLLIAGASALLLFVLLLVLGRPAAHAIKHWQARRHAANALRFIDKEEWKEGRDEAVAALQLGRTEPEALRAVARFLSRTHQADALEFWKQLAAISPLTRQDERDKATAALTTENLAAADEAVEELLRPQEGGPTPEDWLLAAQLAARRNAADRAGSYLEKVMGDSRATKREVLQASLLQIAMAGNENAPAAAKPRAEAWNRVEKFSKGSDAVALDALVLLAQRALGSQRSEDGGQRSEGGPKAESGNSETLKSKPLTQTKEPITATASALADALAAHPLAKTPQQLLAIDLRIAAAPEKKEELIQGAIERWKDADNESLGVLAKWLNGKGAFERELSAIPLQRALQSRDLFLQHVDALGALGRWGEIKRLLTSERFPLDPTIANMYLARCNAQLGEKTSSENNWQRALESAGGDVQKLMTLADYAEKNGATATAEAAYSSAIASAPKLRPAWQGRLRLAQATRDTKAIHAVLAEMLKTWPNDTAIQNDEAYLRLLLFSEQKPEVERNALARHDVDEARRVREKQGPNQSGKSKVEWSALARRDIDVARRVRERQRPNQTEAVSSASGKAPPSDLRSPISDLGEIERLAFDLVQRAPTSLPHRTLLALVYLKENRPATALGVYENLQVPTGALMPSALAVHAAVLAANGNAEGAAKEAAEVPRTSLLPEENALISGL